MINYKTPEEIKIMQRGGEIASKVLAHVVNMAKAGTSLKELDDEIDGKINELGGKASFKTVENYSWASCINVNSGIVHGIPNDYRLNRGDIVSIDLGVLFKGYHTDLSYTFEVETNKEKKFLETGKKALYNAIKQCKIGNTIGDISYAIQSTVESSGYSVSLDLVGHGIGKELHESPYVPCYGEKGTGPKILEGLVVAVEVIYQKGRPDLVLAEDNWTLETKDKSLSGLYEVTVAATKLGPVLITNFNLIDGNKVF